MKLRIHFSIIVLFSGFLLACAATDKEKTDQQPNVIFILADDLGRADLGCYGQEHIQTPNIDRMAEQGMLFTQYYAGSPVCAPSRSTLMTGQHTGHTYVRGNKEIKPEGQEPLAASVFTLAELFAEKGYVNGAFGKWGLGFVDTEGDPLNQGFDRFFGYNCQRQSHRYYPTHLWDNAKRIDYKGNNPQNNEGYAPDIIQKQALSFIEKNRNKPFFLFLPYTLPHAELKGPDDSIFNMYKGKFPETPYKGSDYNAEKPTTGYASQQYPKASYAAMVTRLDTYVGQVLAKLKELGIEKNTLIVFTSDNGPAKEGGSAPDFFNNNGNLRGYKRDVYEGGIRAPLIAYWPGKVEAGSSNNHIGAMWDWLPTFAELIGNSVPASTDGISMLPTLLGKKGQAEHDYLYWEFHEQGGKQAIRKDEWKAVKLNVKKQADAPIELYNLASDPSESKNVADEHPDMVKEMQKLMNEAHVESSIFPFLKTKKTKQP